MTKSPRYKMLLRTVLSGVIGSRLSSAELRSLSEELRRGQLPDELAYMIDLVNIELESNEEASSDDEMLKFALDLLKQRKISKAKLVNIMKSIGVSPVSTSATISTILEEFMNNSSAVMRRKMIDVLQSSSTIDPYLAGMSNNRK